MEHRPLLSPASWARDFAVIGLFVGALAPYFVIFDAGFAIAAGLAGAGSGAVVGATSAWTLERVRGVVPLAFLMPAMAFLGMLWGGFAGGCGGMASRFPHDPVDLGILFGGLGGALTLGVGFLPYLVLSVRGHATLPMLALGILAAPVMGWTAFTTLGIVGFAWKLILPVMVLGAVGLVRSERSVARARRSLPEHHHALR